MISRKDICAMPHSPRLAAKGRKNDNPIESRGIADDRISRRNSRVLYPPGCFGDTGLGVGFLFLERSQRVVGWRNACATGVWRLWRRGMPRSLSVLFCCGPQNGQLAPRFVRSGNYNGRNIFVANFKSVGFDRLRLVRYRC